MSAGACPSGLGKVCNAPNNKDGVVNVLDLSHGRVNLVHIGCSVLGRLSSEIVSGLHNHESLRSIKWTCQLIKHQTDAWDRCGYMIPEHGEQNEE